MCRAQLKLVEDLSGVSCTTTETHKSTWRSSTRSLRTLVEFLVSYKGGRRMRVAAARTQKASRAAARGRREKGALYLFPAPFLDVAPWTA
mmetsp:Transcript_9331/g.28114  ORF Transcript_9331/g.28114 Transcript_9331/m.28114 type:complete len:90 (+) Transcript_9331:551-820(+)